MSGRKPKDGLGRDTSPGQTGSQAQTPSTSSTQRNVQSVQRSNPGALPPDQSKEGRQDAGIMSQPPPEQPSLPARKPDPKRFSWAAVVARGTSSKTMDMRDTAPSSTPSQHVPATTLKGPSPNVATFPAPSRINEARKQESTSAASTTNPDVVGPDDVTMGERACDSSPENTRAPPPQPNPSMVGASSAADRSAEQNRLLDLKRYLRELAGTHDFPSRLREHLSDKDDSETTFKTADLLFKDFVARLSGEFSAKDKSLRDTRLQLETSRSAQANFEKEKKALEDVIQEKDARMGELASAEQARQACESRYQDLEERLTSLTAERDAATLELRETRTKLQAAVSEYNEKEIAMQQLGYALEQAQRLNQKIAPLVDTEAMRVTISDLHEELKGVKADKANLERKYERAKEAYKQKDDERSKQLEHQDVFVKNLQDKNDKYEEMVQRLRHEKDEQLRKAARAEAERAPTTFRVDNEILTLEEYEKRLDNARGDIADLQERLDQAENDRETVMQEELTVDDVRNMFKDTIVPIYSVAAEEQAFSLFSIWNDEEGGLMSLVGKDGYHEYLRVAVEPDRLPSEASSPGLVGRGGERLNMRDFDSRGSEPASPPAAGQSLKNELEDFSRESSVAPEDIRTGEGDISAKLREELAESQAQRAKARERIEELESETKKQQSDIDMLQGEIRKLKETTVNTEDLSKETETLEKKDRELAGCEAQRVKANERIEELEGEAKKQQNEIDRLQSQIRTLETIAASNEELSKEAEALKKRVHELAGHEAQHTKARERIEELENETKKTQNEIGRLQDEIRKLEKTVASIGNLGEEAVALRKRVQELEQHIADHEETAKNDKQAELDECQARREQADKEIEELKAEAKRSEKELRKLKDKFALQQRMDETLKRQIDAAQSKASKAEAKAHWAEARILLQNQSADGQDANSSSVEDDPDQHLELLTNLFNRVNDAEVQLGESHQEVESMQIIVSALRVRIGELEAQQRRLLQEKEQLQDDLKAYAESGQVVGEENIALEEELRRKEEKLQEKEADIEEMNADIRKLKEELEAKKEELKEKQKALDDCHAHGKALKEQVAELEGLQGDGTQDDESEDEDDDEEDNDEDDESQKKITSLEEKIAELEMKVKAEAFKAQNEAARRHEVEENGVWEGTSGVALANKQTELDNFKMGHDNIVRFYKKEVEALKESLSANEAELERTKLNQQQAVDELKARLETSEGKSRDHATRLENTKLEHQKVTDGLRDRLKAAEKKKCNHVDTDLEEVKRGHQLIVDELQAKLEASEGKSRDNDANSERIKIEHEQAIKELEARLAVSDGKRCKHVDIDLEQVKREHQQAMGVLQSRLEAAEKDSLTNHAELERVKLESQRTVESPESKIEAAENTRRSHDAEVEKIKLEHQQTESDLKSKLEAEKKNSRTSHDELERTKSEHKHATDELEARLKAADARTQGRTQGRDDSALDEIKLEHQRALDDLESRHEATENGSRRSHDAEMERIKTEHQKAMDGLKAKLSALEDGRDALKDPCKDAQSTAGTTATDAATQEETAIPTNVDQLRPRPRGAHLDVTNTVPFSTRPPQRMIDTALLLQRRELMMLETLHRRLYEQVLSSGAPKTSEAGTAGPPETTPASTSDGSAQPSASPDQKLDTPGPTIDNQHAVRLKNIKQSCEAFAEKIRENEEYTKRNDVRSTLHKEIRALRQRLRDVEAKQGDGAMDDVDQQQQQQGADDTGAKDADKLGNEHREEHDGASEDDQDPGDDTVAILKRIARLERKMDKTQTDEHGQEEAVLDLLDRMGQGPRHLHGLGGHPCEPFCTRNSIIKKNMVMAQASTLWRRPEPPRPSESDEDDEDYESSSDGDSHGDDERARLGLGAQEALVRSIQAQLVKFYSFAEACDEALDDIYRADEDLMAIPDPVPGGQVRSRSRDRRAMTPAERAAREVEDRNALLRANAYDDPASDASSIASDDDLYSVDGDPNRALKSFIPHTVFNILKSWKTRTEGLLEGADRIQSDVEALIHAGYNSERYQGLKRRIRRLRKIIADAAATNAHLRAQLSEGIAASTDDDLREKVRDLRHQNNTLREQLRIAEQSGEDGGAGDERLGQLRKELMQEKALVHVEQTKFKWLAEEKDELEVIIEKRDETIRKLEASQAKAIQDGLDREMRETLFDNDELNKEVDQLKGEVGGLKQRLRDEFMNKSAQVETAQAVVQGMKKRLSDAQRRSDVAEDKRSTLMTDIARALEIDGENDRTRLDKTRRRLSNILCRVEEADADAGDEGDNKAVDDYNPVLQRERELVREILDERKKRAEHLAEERKRYEGRLGERHAEYEKQVEDWKAMHDAAEKARGLAERNLMDTLDEMGILQKKFDWQEGMLASLDKRLQEQCTITQQLTEELDGTNNADGEDGEDALGGDETAGDHEVGGVEVGGGTSAGGQSRGRTPGEEGPRTPRQPHEQPPGGAAAGDPGDDGDSSNDSSDGDSDDDNEYNNNNNPARTPRDRSRCACPCVGLCNDPTNPIFDGLPADAKNVVRDLGRVYKSYRACCGTKRGATSASAAAAAPGDDGRLLWRLMGIMRADADVREQIRNADRGYAPRLLLAFRRCLWARLLSWAQAVATLVGGLLHCAASVLPDGRWKPRRPGALPPQRAAIVAQDVLVLCVLYQAWRVVKVSRAAREVWEMANRYTRAYFVERGLHPERSRWFGLDGVDMRLLGTSDDPVMVPLSTAVGDGMGG